MSIADELRKLEELHASGALTDDEFARAKAAVLTGVTKEREPVLDAHLQEIKLQNELERLDREWQMERERYMLTGKHGYRYVPNRWTSILLAIVSVGFGILWISMTISSRAPSFFPLFGGVIIVAGVGMGIYTYLKAGEYEEAFRRYQRRRAALVDEYDAPGWE